MPTWTSIDVRNSILASIVPVGASWIGTMIVREDPEVASFLERQHIPGCDCFPVWVPCRFIFYCAMNIATTVPLGYASYLVWKMGGGFQYPETSTALVLYGANILTGIALVPSFKSHKTKSIAINASVLAILALTTTVAFYRIERSAGYWMLPYALWTSYSAIASAIIHFHQPHVSAIE